MKREHLKQLIADKRATMEPLAPEEVAKGFRGWYSSKQLPHFDAPGTQQFITWRLADSVPASRRAEWKVAIAMEDEIEKFKRIETFLDSGLGACHLRDERIAQLVQDNLWHHDGRKYRLFAWVLMPNHVHVLIELWETPMGDVLNSWKGYTAKEANKILRRSEDEPSQLRTKTFWAEDYFDRYIRDEAHFRRVVRYIENNPVKAKLVRTPEDWAWSSARWRKQTCVSEAPRLTHPVAERVAPEKR